MCRGAPVMHSTHMATALSPYLTTGVALVGAGVIAVAPLPLPSDAVVDVAPPVAPRAVTADVALTGLVDELFTAVQLSVTETVKLYTESLPATLAGLVAQGRFAHIAVLAVNTAYLTPLTIIAPFAVAALNQIPFPFGTTAGVINEALKVVIQTPALTAVSIMSLFASIIDDGLSPFDAIVGSIGVFTNAVSSVLESIEKIGSMLVGALPIADLAPLQEMSQPRQQAMAVETTAFDDADVVAVEVDPPAVEGPAGATTAAPTSLTVEAEDPPGEDRAAVTEADDEAQVPDEAEEDAAGPAETPNGGTDLSDGNLAEPGTSADEPAIAATGGAVAQEDVPTDTQPADADPETEAGSDEDAGSVE